MNVTNTTLSGNYAQFVGGHQAGTKGGLTDFASVVFLGNADADNANSEFFHYGTLNLNGQNIIGSSTTEFDASVSTTVDNASASTVFAATVSSSGVDAGVLADNGGRSRRSRCWAMPQTLLSTPAMHLNSMKQPSVVTSTVMATRRTPSRPMPPALHASMAALLICVRWSLFRYLKLPALWSRRPRM